MSDRSTLRLVSDFVVRLLLPLNEATEDIDSFRAFFRRLGFAVGADDIPDGYLKLADDILGAVSIVQSLADDASLSDVDPVFKAVSSIYKDLTQLPPPSGINISAQDLAVAVIEVLVTDLLIRDMPQVWSVLRHLGLTATEYHPAASGSTGPAFVTHKVLWGDLPKVLSNPASIPGRVYDWGAETFDFASLANDLFHALSTLGVYARVRTQHPDPVLSMQSFVEQPSQMRYVSSRALDVIMMDDTIADQSVEVGVSLLPLPGEGTHKPGLVLQPLVPDNLTDTIALTDNLNLVLKGSADLTTAFGVVIRPGETPFVKQPFTTGATPLTGDASLALETTFDTPVVLLGSPSGSRLDVAGLRAAVEFLASTNSAFEARFDLGVKNVSIVLSGGDGDGFIGTILGNSEKKATFSFGLRWSTLTGLSFSASGGFTFSDTVDFSIGPIHITKVALAITGKQRQSGAGEIEVSAGVALDAALGPVTASVDGIGVRVDVAYEAGNAGPLDIAAGFKPPTGIGISIDAGSVSGGGFIDFDEPNGRYFGALELSVYDISVKAFGLIDTKFPDGHKGFSFVIVISAEFTPIQLGFGFTLNGVGGMLGINRTIDADGLLTAIRKGELENVLFPHDVVSQAPAILHDLETIFPGAEGHYVFGPMAKLAWLELVEGELGIIIEFPGPRLAIIGVVTVALPTPDEALVDLHFDVGGILDFPKKSFSLDATLTKESRVGDFPISGDMAMRLSWGDNSNFALAVGGFNKHFTPPTGFPQLKPVTIDLGVHGNPSINLSGYMALTSNTAQTGASLEARVSQSGASLYGFVTFDALFVFSPFSFVGTLDGAVGVDFHGYGFSMHLHGQVSGPSPWKISGSVCVSILWWDACVGFTLPPLGNDVKVSLPGLDPWTGSALKADGTQDVPGLQQVLADPKNWGGGRVPGAFPVVTLVAPLDPKDPPPVDPLGSATAREKVCPLELKITKFAGTKPSVVRTFHVKTVTIGPAGQAGTTTLTDPPTVSDLFAPGQYQDMKDADLLSSPSFVSMAGGFSIQSDATTLGTSAAVGLLYDTVVFKADGTTVEATQDFNPTRAHVTTTTKRSAVALFGIRLGGSSAFFNFIGQRKLTFGNEGYVITSLGNLKTTTTFPLNSPVPRPLATTALQEALGSDPTTLQKTQVTPYFVARP